MLTHRTLLSRLDDIGGPQVVGAALEQNAGAGIYVLLNGQGVGSGQVFLLEQLVIQPDLAPGGVAGAFDPSPTFVSPTFNSYGVTINDQAGNAQHTMRFLSFVRQQSAFVVEDSPNWRNAPPGNVTVWKLKYPIAIPHGWSIQTLLGGQWGNQVAAYGRVVSEDGARTMGYNVSTSTTDANRRMGVDSIVTTTAAETIVAARADQHIRILDIHIRMQPSSAGTNLLTIETDQDSELAGPRTIFTFANDNPSDMLELKFSPDIVLEAGRAIQAFATQAGTASVVISYEYLDPREVPGDLWWAHVIPDRPTPGVTKLGTASNVATISSAVECYYPKLALTKTLSTQSFQHLLRGYCFSLQKAAVASPDQTAMRLSTGGSNSASARPIKNTVIGMETDTTIPLSPVFTATAHDQCIYGAIDSLNLACPATTGGLWVDTIAAGDAAAAAGAGAGILDTPESTTADVDNWSWTVWGKTIPTKFSDPYQRSN